MVMARLAALLLAAASAPHAAQAGTNFLQAKESQETCASKEKSAWLHACKQQSDCCQLSDNGCDGCTLDCDGSGCRETGGQSATKETSFAETSEDPTSSPMLGGFCECYGAPVTWAGIGDILLPGGFQSDATALPVTSNWDSNKYKEVFLTIGGNSVVGDNCLDASWIIDAAGKVGATGVGFDMEGCLDGKTYDDIKAVAADIQAKGSTLKILYIPILGSDMVKIPYDESAGILIAPMAYAGPNSYGPYNPTSADGGWTSTLINQRLTDNLLQAQPPWPKNKIFLTFSSLPANNCLVDENLCSVTWPDKDPLAWLASTVKDEGYAGLFGWPSGDEATDQKTWTYAQTVMQR